MSGKLKEVLAQIDDLTSPRYGALSGHALLGPVRKLAEIVETLETRLEVLERPTTTVAVNVANEGDAK